MPAERLRRLVVDWPSQSLRGVTLIDTPGIASTSAHNSPAHARLADAGRRRPRRGGRGRLPDAPPARRGRGVPRVVPRPGRGAGSSVNTIAVISRADEVGGGRIDAMLSARRIARRYRTEPALRGLCQTVIAGGRPARGDRPDVAAGRVRRAGLARRRATRGHGRRSAVHPTVPALGPGGRAHVAVLRAAQGAARAVRHLRSTTRHDVRPAGPRLLPALAAELVRASGLHELQAVLSVAVRPAAGPAEGTQRPAGGGAGAGRRPARGRPGGGGGPRGGGGADRLGCARVRRAAPAVRAALRRGRAAGGGGGDRGTAARRPGRGTRRSGWPWERRANDVEVRAAALHELDRWRRRAEDPFADRPAVRTYRAVARTCEGLVAALSAPARQP